MEPIRSNIYNASRAGWEKAAGRSQFQTGVSLHSHTLHSRESLDFIPRLSGQIPVLGSLVRWELERYRRIHGADLDWENAWWTPPLSPRQAWEVETSQIERSGLRALVSLTDHDNIDAPLALRATEFGAQTPVSFEWTFPYFDTFFHFGIHQLPVGGTGEAEAWLERMQAYTNAPRPDIREGLAILRELCGGAPGCLVVLNHPLWDEKGIGATRHNVRLRQLLAATQGTVHALELNGLRSATENSKVARMSEEVGLPVISGGDRHTWEPNACINLTNAASFSDFVGEVRYERQSNVLWMPHYRNPLVMRIARNVSEVLRTNPSHCLGWTRWSDRVFYTPAGSNRAVPVGQAWEREPWIVSAFVASIGLLG